MTGAKGSSPADAARSSNGFFVMPLNSVNTNASALIALQNLNAVNRELQTTQNRISTGLRVASAKDDGAIWAIAQNQRAEMKSLDAVKGSLQRGQSIVDVALSAGETVADLLTQMKEVMVAASDTSLTAQEKAALNEDYLAFRKQIDIVVKSADFNGVNLISAGGTGQIRALANANATATIDVDHIDLSTTGAALAGVPADLTGTITSTQIDALSAGFSKVTSALGRLGTGSKSLDTHLTFVGKLQDTFEISIGRLVDADLAKESAKLQALQVKQQLAIQALSMANSQSRMLLQLFQRAA